MAASTTALVTTEQFLAQREQYDSHGNRIKDELIAGEVVLMAPPTKIHDLIKNEISQVLIFFLAARKELGLGVYVELAFAVTEHDTFVPDVSVVRKARLLEGTSRIMSGAPEIAVEVISPTDTAAHVKSKIAAYLANGSRSVWIVYPSDQSVVVHTAESAREIKGGQPLEDGLLPGFSEPVARFFQGL